jgi:hypothetical protein
MLTVLGEYTREALYVGVATRMAVTLHLWFALPTVVVSVN